MAEICLQVLPLQLCVLGCQSLLGIPRLILHNTDNKVSQCLQVARSVETDLVVDWSVLYSQSYHSRIRKIRRWVKGSVVTLH